jgi:hypothetical protein
MLRTSYDTYIHHLSNQTSIISLAEGSQEQLPWSLHGLMDNIPHDPSEPSAETDASISAKRSALRDSVDWEALYPGSTELHQAVFHRLYSRVHILLSQGVPVDVQDYFGNQPLHVASSFASTNDMAEILLNLGAGVNSRGRNGQTPLHMAIRNAGPVDLLLASRPDLSIKDTDGNTALHFAMLSPHPWALTCVERMISMGASVNTRNTDGYTPSMLVAERTLPSGICHNPFLMLCLDNHADLSLLSPSEKTLFQQFLATSRSPTTLMEWNGDPATTWSETGLDQDIKAFLQHGADPDTEFEPGISLVQAAWGNLVSDPQGDYELLDMLCSTIDPNPPLITAIPCYTHVSDLSALALASGTRLT